MTSIQRLSLNKRSGANHLFIIILVASGFLVYSFQSVPAEADPAQKPNESLSEIPPTFEATVLPVLKANNCLNCHGANLKLKNMDLSSYESLTKGSETGPVVVPGKPEDSRLYQLIQEGKMPPGGSRRVSTDEVARVRSWIAAGAKSSYGAVEASATKTTQMRSFRSCSFIARFATDCENRRLGWT